MREEFEQIIRRLRLIRNRMDEYIDYKGGDTENCKSIYDFVNAISLIPDLSEIRNGIETFKGNTNIQRLPADLINAQEFNSMYKFAMGCTELRYVPELLTYNVTTFVYAFYGCTKLEEIAGLDTSSATTLGEAFHNCTSLKRIGGELDVSKIVSQMDTTFTGCSSLEYLRFTGELRADIWLSGAPKLTIESLQSVIDSLADLAREGASAKKITFGAKNKAKLSADQLETVSYKGWTLR